ncbi:MAG: ABC transporter permease [Spirochaetes bacterium]|jgi:ribose transport system permease protein|nr:ABC transporter permease [Spirochaetota bacterium]
MSPAEFPEHRATLPLGKVLRSHAEVVTIYGLLVLIAAAGAVFAPDFLKTQNLMNILLQSVALGLVAIGQTFVILGGGIDLSVGATISMVAVYSSGLMAGNPALGVALPVLLLVVCMALAVGLLNSLLVSRLHIAPFIATMAVGSLVQGIVLMYTKRPKGRISPWWGYFANGTFGPVPVAVLFLILAIVVAHLLLTRTVLGRYIFATGGSERSARLSGIQTERVILFTYLFSSFMAALSALFLISRMGVGDPQVGGLNYDLYDLNSIAAVLVGGTALTGGVGSIIGTVAGFLIVSLLNNIFNLVGVNTFFQWIIRGLIILAAVAVYRMQRKRA